ncbi:T9SS type A sorting domain-containing protein [Edaphocola flava]|uniref:T9SS type A sorting domain-containing protein n=1 Tax=Edaphocola flava TaxID=2499629 RepID=UPI00100ABB7E|nr:T9SS type A sorting domain-containing protein [Edaphocola flava]
MNKKLLLSALLLGSFATAIPGLAQNASVVPEAPLPNYTFGGGTSGPVVRPQNASASTMQDIIGPSGATENLYIHSWDVYSSAQYNGIAWRRTDASGSLINEDYIPIKYADDIDAVIFEDGGAYFVLAAYYYNDGFGTKGHYYDIYKWDVTGLVPVSIMNLLSTSPNFGRINVDATVYGLAIIWCEPLVGISTTVSFFPGVSFGPNVLLPGTDDKIDPDVCIRRGGGGSNTGLDLQMTFLNNTQNVLYEYRLPFFNALSGSAAGFTYEYGTGTVGTNKYSPPRIDCPDIWNTQRWAVSIGINNVTGTTNTEWIYAMVKNDDWSPTPSLVNLSYVSYTSTTYPEYCNPVLAYNDANDQIFVGWITRQSTALIPSTYDVKYVASDIKDNGGAAPAFIPGSFNMISNTVASHEPVLAFSGQDRNSGFDGLYTAFSQYATVFPSDYSMMSKTRKWTLSTFKGLADLKTDKVIMSVTPNPFAGNLNFQAPGDGKYKVSLFSIDGREVYSNTATLTQGQAFQFSTEELASGTYIVKVLSPENGVNYTQKMVKK